MPPECVVKATEEYQEDEDALRDFIAEKIERAKDEKLPHKKLYAAYKQWHLEGSAEKPFSSKRIAEMFRERGYKTPPAHAGAVIWWGIRLRESGNGVSGEP